MKAMRQQKQTIAPRKRSTTSGCTEVQNPNKKVLGLHQKVTAIEDQGVFTSITKQALSQQLSSRTELFAEPTKKVSALEPKFGQLDPSTKIKLQLYPIDEITRIRLEKDGHHPFLELSLKARKKISSVIKHINTKWRSANVAIGEPMLFPYHTHLDNAARDRRWTLNDTEISAGDVYKAIESPSVFRLRYGWFSNSEPQHLKDSSTYTPFACLQSEGLQKGSHKIPVLSQPHRKEHEMASQELKTPVNTSKTADADVTKQMSSDVTLACGNDVKTNNDLAQSTVQWADSLTNLSIGNLLSGASFLGMVDKGDLESNWSKTSLRPMKFISDISIGGLLSETSLQGKINNCESACNHSNLGLQPTQNKGLLHSKFPWDDSLTSLSIGGLLSEVSMQGKPLNCDPKSNASSTALISDSTDAFLSGGIKSHSQVAKPSSNDFHSSILDAEETCHAFSFGKFSSGKDVATSARDGSGACNHEPSSNSSILSTFSELNKQSGFVQDRPCHDSKTLQMSHSLVYDEDSSIGLRGIKWNDSLGPFDLGISTLRQVSSGNSVTFSEFLTS